MEVIIILLIAVEVVIVNPAVCTFMPCAYFRSSFAKAPSSRIDS